MKYNSQFAVETVAVIALMSTPVIGAEEEAQLHQRQQAVACRGVVVMPFDLSRTTHVFDDQVDGGLQTVTANDPSDTAQIYLIRDHFADRPIALRVGTLPNKRGSMAWICLVWQISVLATKSSRSRIRYSPMARA